MKLQELNRSNPTDQINRVIESRLGGAAMLANLTRTQTVHMLTRVRGLLKEARSKRSFHTSEKNAGYLKAVMLEQALTSQLEELDDSAMVVDVNDPKTKATMQKAERGQTLTPDEQKTMNAIALTKTEGRKSKPMVREQSELQQAQVVLASQDMIDRLQGMLEDISEMQFKDLPALVDSIRQDMGVDQATQFQTAASQALTTLLQAVQSGKTEMEAAQGVLTGQPVQVPGEQSQPGATDDMGTVPASGEVDLGPSLDANIDDEELTPAGELGRERR
jgi:hypothetical protein